MAQRFCSRCGTDVEDVGGFCLLGHRLAVEAAISSLGDLRVEVDKAFEEARMQVANALATASGHPSAPPPPPPPPGHVAGPIEEATRPSVWSALEDCHEAPGDPIVAFAPAPRMDWGPQRKARWRAGGNTDA